jgi:hypothetical protein
MGRVHSIAARSREQDDEDEGVVEDHRPRIPDGVYLAKFTGHTTAVLFGRATKIFLHFEVVEGEYAGTKLFRAYRVKRLNGKAGPGGKFVLSANGDCYRMLARVLDVCGRPDRVSPRGLKRLLLKLRTRTVEHDSSDRPLPVDSRYSVVDEIENGT